MRRKNAGEDGLSVVQLRFPVRLPVTHAHLHPSAVLASEGLCLSGTVCSENSNWNALGVSVGVALTLSAIPCHPIQCLAPVGLWDSCLLMEETMNPV